MVPMLHPLEIDVSIESKLPFLRMSSRDGASTLVQTQVPLEIPSLHPVEATVVRQHVHPQRLFSIETQENWMDVSG